MVSASEKVRMEICEILEERPWYPTLMMIAWTNRELTIVGIISE